MSGVVRQDTAELPVGCSRTDSDVGQQSWRELEMSFPPFAFPVPSTVLPFSSSPHLSLACQEGRDPQPLPLCSSAPVPSAASSSASPPLPPPFPFLPLINPLHLARPLLRITPSLPSDSTPSSPFPLLGCLTVRPLTALHSPLPPPSPPPLRLPPVSGITASTATWTWAFPASSFLPSSPS